MMSEANNQTSPVRHGIELDFNNLPDMPNMEQNHHYDINFNIEDLFSTGAPMPSSPPKMFNLYEDPLTRGGGNSINWNDFGRFGEKEDEVKVKEEPEESPRKLGDGATGKEQPA